MAVYGMVLQPLQPSPQTVSYLRLILRLKLYLYACARSWSSPVSSGYKDEEKQP